MTVHVGLVTSEVRSSAPTQPDAVVGEPPASIWDERIRVAAMLERVARDRLRTATGHSDD